MEHTSYGTIHDFVYKMLALPLRALGTSYIGSILTVFAISILWSVGINSGSMVNGFVINGKWICKTILDRKPS